MPGASGAGGPWRDLLLKRSLPIPFIFLFFLFCFAAGEARRGCSHLSSAEEKPEALK